MDDTFVIQKEENKQNSLQHINSVDPAIQFTVENNKEDGPIPFLDAIVKPETDRKLSITVNRKPMHTDQYLQWDSHYHLSTKYSVIITLTHRAITVCSNPELLQKEMQHLRKALTNCNYPKWGLDKVEKGLLGLPVRSTMRITARALQAPCPLPMKLKPSVILSYHTPRVSAKALKSSVGGMVYKPTSKVIASSKTYWCPPRTKIPWPTKVKPYTGSNVVTLPVMMNT